MPSLSIDEIERFLPIAGETELTRALEIPKTLLNENDVTRIIFNYQDTWNIGSILHLKKFIWRTPAGTLGTV